MISSIDGEYRSVAPRSRSPYPVWGCEFPRTSAESTVNGGVTSSRGPTEPIAADSIHSVTRSPSLLAGSSLMAVGFVDLPKRRA